MTLTDQTKKTAQTGDASNKTWSFSPMVIFALSELEVVTEVTATGVETARTQGTGSTNWSSTITTFPATGSITYPATGTALASTVELHIRRKLTLEQQTDLNNQGGYFPEVQETQFDKLVMIDLQQQEQLDRSFRFPFSYNGATVTEIPAPISGDGSKFLRLKSGLDGLEWAAVATTTGSASDVTAQDVSLSAGSAGTNALYARDDHVHLLPTVTVAKGGTESTTVAAAQTKLLIGGTDIVNTFTKTQTWTKGADLTSPGGGTLTLGTDGNYFDVTGTNTITAITGVAGTFFVLQSDGALPYTDAAGLDMGGASITTAAGDRLLFFMLTTTLAQLIGGISENVGFIQVAPQAVMETGTSITRMVTPGRMQNHPGVAKAWALVDQSSGTAAIISSTSHNVSGIADGATGLFTVTLDTDMSSANYVAVVMAGQKTTDDNHTMSQELEADSTPAATGMAFVVNDDAGVAVDVERLHVAFFGDQ